MKESKAYIILGCFALAVLVVFIFFKAKSQSTPLKINLEVNSHTAYDKTSDSSHLLMAETPGVPSTSRPLANPDKPFNFSKILEQDDICELHNLAKAPVSLMMEKIIQLYFRNSQAKNSYDDYQKFRTGLPPEKNSFARLNFYLAQANLVLSPPSDKKIQIDLDSARAGLEQLANEDSANAALPFFLLMIADKKTPNEVERLKNKILQLNKFNTYRLDFAEEIANSDAPTAIGLVAKIEFLMNVVRVDWITITKRIKNEFQNSPELQTKIGNLMIGEAIKSRKRSSNSGFDLVEFSIGRNLLKNKIKIPNVMDNIDRYLPQSLLNTPERINSHVELSSECNELIAKELRDFYLKIRSDSTQNPAGR